MNRGCGGATDGRLRPSVFALLLAGLAITGFGAAPAGVEPVATIEGTAALPRNSEGAFATLQSGRIIYCFSQFHGNSDDNGFATLAAIASDDDGRTWGAPYPVLSDSAAMNVMSVSLLRLRSGGLALFYLVKRNAADCRPVMQVSKDEGRTWSARRTVVEAPGYFVLNNDRVIQTRAGRLIVPVAFHRVRRANPAEADAVDDRGITLWYYSDDEGATWKEAADWWAMPGRSISGLQEPGVVERADGSLFSWSRTDQGAQYGYVSADGGMTWSPPRPTSLQSPLSPAGIKRLPDRATLVAVYNDHSGKFPFPGKSSTYGGRTPLVIALSEDGGATWPVRKLLGGDPACDYAYPAIHFTRDAVLVGDFEWDGRRAPGGSPLFRLCIRRIEQAWLEAAP